MSGITDEAAIETHDLMEQAEEERQRLHPGDEGRPATPPHVKRQEDTTQTAKDSKSGGHERYNTTMHKVKKALHMEK